MADSLTPVKTREATPLDYVSAGFVYAFVGLLRLFPFAWVSAIGGALASTFGPMLKPSKNARENLRRTFPEKSEAEIAMILRGAWENLGNTAFEFAVMDQLLTDKGKHRVEIEGLDVLERILNSGKPVLFFGAHQANWELLPVSSNILGFVCHIFYRAPNNPLLQNLFAQRYGTGELIPKGAPGAKRAFALLKKNEHLGILVDQKLNDGIAVPFMGRDAMTGTAIAEFALRFDAPMVPIQCIRLPGARFKVIYQEPLQVTRTDDKKTDVRTVMTDINATIEGWIREYPDQWLWQHNRWPK
ncbi:lauroyl acyltransferase [Magnetovibrio sp. PR-2]|uniref:lysophospholipid acyltransferase family protein n=1 Tax=Magnetovibrio sp. PR-2 TaxID=3120356 RepID=UPI002FCE5E90